MAAAAKTTKAPTWVTFWGSVLLFIGAFMAMRTLVNMFIFQKYPTTPSTSLASLVGFSQTLSEESCSSFGQATPDQSCLKYVADTRESARTIDIAHSLFFLFTGGSILYFRKKLYK